MVWRKRHSPSWLLLLAGVVLIRLSTRWPEVIEQKYVQGWYRGLSFFLRTVTGWLPFSLGDILYLLALIAMMRELFIWMQTFRHKHLTALFLQKKIERYVLCFLSIYLLFNLLWGMNYNREGIAQQIGLVAPNLSDTAVQQLAISLRDRTNTLRPDSEPSSEKDYNTKAQQGYLNVSKQFPFLTPGPMSIKSSLYGALGNYLGYSGYYNPFTGEAQVNTSIPRFMIPFVTCHEMGHQLGYAKENEASFVGHLAARASGDRYVQYSSYLNMFLYAHRELRGTDSVAAKNIWDGLDAGVKADLRLYRQFLQRYDSPIGDWVDKAYHQFLKLNEQPAGMRSYNLVVIWLLAYYQQRGDI